MKCSTCGGPATHKVAEDNLMEHRHPFTNYLCCEHFGLVMGGVAQDWCKNNHIDVYTVWGSITIDTRDTGTSMKGSPR